MLTAYTRSGQTLTRKLVNLRAELPQDAVWVDLNDPTDQERNWVREQYGQELQFIEELSEIEASARYYHDTTGLHINLYFLALENGLARNVNVAFTISNQRLFTLRTDELPEIRTFFSHASKNAEEYPTPASMLLGLVAARVAILADVYEKLQKDLDAVSGSIVAGRPHVSSFGSVLCPRPIAWPISWATTLRATFDKPIGGCLSPRIPTTRRPSPSNGPAKDTNSEWAR